MMTAFIFYHVLSPDIQLGARTMNCPSCNAFMKRETVEGVEIDVCPACEGMWFDSGELSSMFTNVDIEKKLEPTGSGGDISCPRCNGKTSESVYGGVSLDVCSACKGIWLDGLELNELLLENELDRANEALASGKMMTKHEREGKIKKLKASRGMELVKRLGGGT